MKNMLYDTLLAGDLPNPTTLTQGFMTQNLAVEALMLGTELELSIPVSELLEPHVRPL
jgi:hypothetical protein